MFSACMVCHGELTRLKPAPRHLTEFYLFMSAGGALGGLFVSLVAPRLFVTYLEWPLVLGIAFAIASAALLCAAWMRRRLVWRAIALVMAAVPAAAGLWFIGEVGVRDRETDRDRAEFLRRDLRPGNF